MIILTHLASGYLISQVFQNNFSSDGIDKGLLTTLALAGANVPDVDGLFGKQIRDHRKTPFHAPLVWMTVILIAGILILLTGSYQYLIYCLVFASGVFTHLFLDWFSGRSTGVRLFYPFSKKQYSLFPLNTKQGGVSIFPNRKNIHEYIRFIKFFFKNKFLVLTEFLIILVGLLVLINRKF